MYVKDLIAILSGYDENLPLEFLVQDDDTMGKSHTLEAKPSEFFPFEEMCGTMTITVELQKNARIVILEDEAE